MVIKINDGVFSSGQMKYWFTRSDGQVEVNSYIIHCYHYFIIIILDSANTGTANGYTATNAR